MTTTTDTTSLLTTGPRLTRRAFVKTGGALVVSLSLPSVFNGSGSTVEAAENTLDPTSLASWLEIREDGTILVRTGKTETGTGMSAFYAQVVAEELNVQAEAITLVLGHTDQTPDGGFSAGFLAGAANLRKVAAYTYQALLQLAADRLAVPTSNLTVTNGVISGGGQSVSYVQLVQGQQLELTIPVTGKLPAIDPSQNTGVSDLVGITVTGDPPTKAPEDYTVIGKSHPSPLIPDKVTGKTVWTGDFYLPGMLHARMVRPATVGSTLVSVGQLDRAKFPTAEVVVKNNLVAVISPIEWEAVAASRVVAAATKWSDWKGLPGSDNLTQAIRAHAWGEPTGSRGDATKVTAALQGASKTISATYEQPSVRHAPISPYVAVADVRRDGTVMVWTHSSQSQGLRAQIANTLSVPVEKVVIRWLEGAGQYGRTTFGGDGAEGDAVILSQLVGKPVRVQWTLQEDLAWSTLSPGWVADATVAVDKQGRITAFQSDWYSPHENDARLLGAILAEMPTITPKVQTGVSTIWPYDKIPNVLERAYGMPNIGTEGSSKMGLRGNIMRTPWQRQQNFVLEALMNEAAAAAGADPIQYRIDHTNDERMIDILRVTADAAKWEARSSPKQTVQGSSGVLQGRGVAVMIRQNAYWAGIAEIDVTLSTGEVKVTNFTVGVELGKVINPRHLRAIIQGGIVMGLGEALTEEVTFDEARVTSTDWSRYRIPTMADTPTIKTVEVARPGVGFGTGGEAPNALPAPAIAAAFYDATGIVPRRVPLNPAYVTQLLKT